MSTMGRSAASTALVIAVLGIPMFGMPGCGETVIDDGKTEGAIEQNLEDSLGKKVSSVDCPSGVEVDAGASFECAVTLTGGKEETVSLKIINDDADVEVTGLQPK